MTRAELIAGLLRAAQAAEDEAAVCDAIARHFRPEHDRLSTTEPPEATPAAHERLMDLYPLVIQSEHRARMHRAEADLLRLSAAEVDWRTDEPDVGMLVIIPGGVGYKGEDGRWHTLTGVSWPGRALTWDVPGWMPLPKG